MADARLPDRYLVDRVIVRLSDTERSCYFMSMLWSVSNRTDGALVRSDLQLIPTFQPGVIPKLVALGLWVETGADSWLIVDYKRSQTTKAEFEVLDNVRRTGREKKARQRARKRGDSPDDEESPGTVPGDVSPGTAQARQGKARQEPVQGSGAVGEAVDGATGEVLGWRTRVPGTGDWIEPAEALI